MWYNNKLAGTGSGTRIKLKQCGGHGGDARR